MDLIATSAKIRHLNAPSSEKSVLRNSHQQSAAIQPRASLHICSSPDFGNTVSYVKSKDPYFQARESSDDTSGWSPSSWINPDKGKDTAENEPLKVWKKIQFIIHSPPYCRELRDESGIALASTGDGSTTSAVAFVQLT